MKQTIDSSLRNESLKWDAQFTHSENGYKKGWHIITGKYDEVINIPNSSEAEANAKLICEAVNNYQALRDSNAELLRVLEGLRGVEAWIPDRKLKEHFQATVYPAINKAKSLNQ